MREEVREGILTCIANRSLLVDDPNAEWSAEYAAEKIATCARDLHVNSVSARVVERGGLLFVTNMGICCSHSDAIPCSRAAEIFQAEAIRNLLLNYRRSDIAYSKLPFDADGIAAGVSSDEEDYASGDNDRKIADQKRIISKLARGTFSSCLNMFPLCEVCKKMFENGDEIIFLACGDILHHECTLRWLFRSKICPKCMKQMEEGDEFDVVAKLF